MKLGIFCLITLWLTIPIADAVTPQKAGATSVFVRKIVAANGGAEALDKATGYADQLQQAMATRIKKNKSFNLVSAEKAGQATYAIEIFFNVYDQSFVASWAIYAIGQETAVKTDHAEFTETPEPDALAGVLSAELFKLTKP